MKIIIELRNDNDDKDSEFTKLIFDHRLWRTEGPALEMKPRVIWLMNTVQELTKEFKRRAPTEPKNAKPIPTET